MRSVLEFLVQFIVALTGAVGGAILLVGGVAAACGAGVMGTGWCIRRWSGRAARGATKAAAHRQESARGKGLSDSQPAKSDPEQPN
jgi:hypothetical protein